MRAAWIAVLAACALACSGGHAEPPKRVLSTAEASAEQHTEPPPAAEATDFEPPDATGYGRAAGLRYLERCLGPCKPGEAIPLVILIHGLGDRPRPDWLASANGIQSPLRLVMPEAPTPYHRGFAWFPFRVGNNEPQALARGIAAAEARLARTMAVLSERRPTRGRPLVMGFSQGGMLSFALALRHPELVALSLPMSGFLPQPLWPADKPAGKRFPRIVATHGDTDDIVPIAPARQLVAELDRLGYAATLREFPGVGHQVTPDMEAFAVELLTEHARNGGSEP